MKKSNKLNKSGRTRTLHSFTADQNLLANDGLVSTKSSCTSRVHSFSAEQKLLAKNGDVPLKLKCGGCGRILDVCKDCFNSKREQWTYVNLAKHLAGGGCAQHPAKRSNGKKRFRASTRNNISIKNCPRVTMATEMANTNGIKFIPSFMPHLPMTNSNAEVERIMSNDGGYASSYTGNVFTRPLTWGQAKFGKEFGSEMAEELMHKIEKHNITVSMVGNTKPFHLFLNRDGYQLTELHSDNDSTLLIMMTGYKRVYIGPFCAADELSFADKLGRTWFWDDERVKFHLDNKVGVTKTIQDHESDLLQAGIFKRLSIGPGDSIFIPKGHVHAVVTAPFSLMLSLAVR